MVQTKRIQREYLLSLWARNRLAERETVSWALDALAKIRGAIGTDSSQLFKILDDEASKCDLSPPFKLLWKLFHKVARESVFNYDFGSIYEFQTKLNEGRIERDDIDRLIDLLRPRLRAKASHHWRIDQADAASDDPISWVGWEFETALHSSYQRDARPPRKALALLASDHLTRLLEGGTAALRDAMDDARQIGWLTESRDLPNLFVHRVFIQEVEKQAEDDDGYDPDDSNNDLVPIVRLLSEAFNALLHKDNAKAIS